MSYIQQSERDDVNYCQGQYGEMFGTRKKRNSKMVGSRFHQSNLSDDKLHYIERNIFKTEKELTLEGLPPKSKILTVEAKAACAKIGIELQDLVEKQPVDFKTSPNKKGQMQSMIGPKEEKDLVDMRYQHFENRRRIKIKKLWDQIKEDRTNYEQNALGQRKLSHQNQTQRLHYMTQQVQDYGHGFDQKDLDIIEINDALRTGQIGSNLKSKMLDVSTDFSSRGGLNSQALLTGMSPQVNDTVLSGSRIKSAAIGHMTRNSQFPSKMVGKVSSSLNQRKTLDNYLNHNVSSISVHTQQQKRQTSSRMNYPDMNVASGSTLKLPQGRNIMNSRANTTMTSVNSQGMRMPKSLFFSNSRRYQQMILQKQRNLRGSNKHNNPAWIEENKIKLREEQKRRLKELEDKQRARMKKVNELPQKSNGKFDRKSGSREYDLIKPVNFEAPNSVVKEHKRTPWAWEQWVERRDNSKIQRDQRWNETKKKAEQDYSEWTKLHNTERRQSLQNKRKDEKSKSRRIYQTLMGNKEMVSNAADTLTPQHKYELNKYMQYTNKQYQQRSGRKTTALVSPTNRTSQGKGTPQQQEQSLSERSRNQPRFRSLTQMDTDQIQQSQKQMRQKIRELNNQQEQGISNSLTRFKQKMESASEKKMRTSLQLSERARRSISRGPIVVESKMQLDQEFEKHKLDQYRTYVQRVVTRRKDSKHDMAAKRKELTARNEERRQKIKELRMERKQEHERKQKDMEAKMEKLHTVANSPVRQEKYRDLLVKKEQNHFRRLDVEEEKRVQKNLLNTKKAEILYKHLQHKQQLSVYSL